jgi:hypothetical protein
MKYYSLHETEILFDSKKISGSKWPTFRVKVSRWEKAGIKTASKIEYDSRGYKLRFFSSEDIKRLKKLEFLSNNCHNLLKIKKVIDSIQINGELL